MSARDWFRVFWGAYFCYVGAGGLIGIASQAVVDVLDRLVAQRILGAFALVAGVLMLTAYFIERRTGRDETTATASDPLSIAADLAEMIACCLGGLCTLIAAAASIVHTLGLPGGSDIWYHVPFTAAYAVGAEVLIGGLALIRFVYLLWFPQYPSEYDKAHR